MVTYNSLNILGGNNLKSKEITMTTFKEYLAKLSEETALLAMDEDIQHGETS